MLRVNYEIMHECFLSCSDYMSRPWWTEIRLSQCDWQYSWLHCSLQMWLWLWASWRAIPWVPLQWLPEWKRTSVQTEVIKLSTRYYSNVHLWLSSTIINNMDAFSRVDMCPDLDDPRYGRVNVTFNTPGYTAHYKCDYSYELASWWDTPWVPVQWLLEWRRASLWTWVKKKREGLLYRALWI